MLSFAALSINRFFTTAPKLERETPGNRTATLRALSDLGESVASSVHAIYAQSRLYLCVAMQPKPEALHAQRLADKKAAAGHFDVDENWSAAEVNARSGNHQREDGNSDGDQSRQEIHTSPQRCVGAHDGTSQHGDQNDA